LQPFCVDTHILVNRYRGTYFFSTPPDDHLSKVSDSSDALLQIFHIFVWTGNCFIILFRSNLFHKLQVRFTKKIIRFLLFNTQVIFQCHCNLSNVLRLQFMRLIFYCKLLIIIFKILFTVWQNDIDVINDLRFYIGNYFKFVMCIGSWSFQILMSGLETLLIYRYW
jgi:hypothetical protein